MLDNNSLYSYINILRCVVHVKANMIISEMRDLMRESKLRKWGCFVFYNMINKHFVLCEV